MATKRKDVDLTANKTATQVAKWVKQMNKTFTHALKKSEINAFTEIASGKDVLQTFFLSHGYFVGVLSDMALITFRRIFRDVLIDNIALETKDAMLRSGANYPGNWTLFKIKTIVAAITSVDMIDGKLTLAMVVPGDDGVSSRPVMPFDEYNPNRLYQYAVSVENATIATIEAEVSHVIPSARRVVGPMRLNERYGNEFHDMVTIGGIRFPDDIPEDMNAAADVVFGVIKMPILSYTISLLHESGLDLRLVREVFRRSEDRLVYSADTNSGRVAGGFVHPWVKVDYIIYKKDDPTVRPTFSATMSDIRAMFDAEPSASCKSRVGAAFQKFVEALVPYAMNMASTDPSTLIATLEVPGEDIEVKEDGGVK